MARKTTYEEPVQVRPDFIRLVPMGEYHPPDPGFGGEDKVTFEGIEVRRGSLFPLGSPLFQGGGGKVTRTSIPGVVPIFRGTEPVIDYAATARARAASNQKELQVAAAQAKEKAVLAAQVRTSPAPGIDIPAPGSPDTIIQPQEPSMDLGDLFGGIVDLGTSYIGAKYGAEPTINWPGSGFAGPAYGEPGGAIGPAMPTLPSGAPPGCGGGKPVYKQVCGVWKWVYPKRRRRKQLLTQSDAAGLAKLKGIVGQGKVMEVWIATHGGR